MRWSLWMFQNRDLGSEVASKIPIPMWALCGCGLLMVAGMTTRNAQRVTRAAVNTGSQYDRIALYAPKWCRKLATCILRLEGKKEALAPQPGRDSRGKRVHFDALRASVIMAVSASVIAFASGQGLPVSTTYVTFAAVVATGMADRAMSRGDADRKVGRAIWVVFCWFAGALLAMVSSAAVAFVIFKAHKLGVGIGGLLLVVGGNIFVRRRIKKRADVHEKRFHEEAGDLVRREEQLDHGELPLKGS